MRMATDPESCDEETDTNENEVFDERDPAFIDERFRVDRRKLEQMLQGIASLSNIYFMKSEVHSLRGILCAFRDMQGLIHYYFFQLQKKVFAKRGRNSFEK